MEDAGHPQARGRGRGDETEAWGNSRSGGATPLELSWALVPLLEDDGSVVRVMVEFARRGWLRTVEVEPDSRGEPDEERAWGSRPGEDARRRARG